MIENEKRRKKIMWIKAHLLSGDEVRIQTQNIAAVYPYQGNVIKEYKGKTTIELVGGSDKYLLVRETMDEIGHQILE